MILNEALLLNNGIEVPELALGIWLVYDVSAVDAVRTSGVAHIEGIARMDEGGATGLTARSGGRTARPH